MACTAAGHPHALVAPADTPNKRCMLVCVPRQLQLPTWHLPPLACSALLSLPPNPPPQARGIVVDGVVASPHVRWGYVWGRLWLPAAVNPYVPAVMEALLTPFWLAYKVGRLASAGGGWAGLGADTASASTDL